MTKVNTLGEGEWVKNTAFPCLTLAKTSQCRQNKIHIPSLVYEALVILSLLALWALLSTSTLRVPGTVASCLPHNHANSSLEACGVVVHSAWNVLASDLARLAFCHSAFPERQNTTQKYILLCLLNGYLV